MEDTKAADIIASYERARGDRRNYESYWQEIAELIMPRYSDTFFTSGISDTKGQKKDREVFDSSGHIALGRFSAAMESMLTPRNQQWHGLRASDPALMRQRGVQMYFDEVRDRLFSYRYSPRANYASQQHEVYMSLGAFGTGAMFIDQLDGSPLYGQGLRYRNIHIAQVYFMENHQGIIDTAIRGTFPMTARQVQQKFDLGIWNGQMPECIAVAMKENKGENEFKFIHCVKPRSDYDPERADAKGKPFASIYVCVEEKVVVHEGGYSSFPYAVSRYVTGPGELYGRSPAMDALPALKTLMEQKKTVLKQGHRAVDPVLLAHDDGVVDSFSMRPGAINAGGVSAEGRALVQTLPVGNIAIGKDLMDDERVAINAAFMVDLFQILVETPQMTATEVLERAREKGALLSPTMGRQQSEFLGPMIERELDVLSAQGLLPPMPPELREAAGEYTIEYDSPLSRAQKAEEIAGSMRAVEFAVNVAAQTQDPSPLDHFDFDKMIPEVSQRFAMPARFIRTVDMVKSIREGRSQAVATQQLIDAGPAMAAMMKANQGTTQ